MRSNFTLMAWRSPDDPLNQTCWVNHPATTPLVQLSHISELTLDHLADIINAYPRENPELSLYQQWVGKCPIASPICSRQE